MQKHSLIRLCHVQVLPLMSGTQRSMLEFFRNVDRDRFELHVACQGSGPLTRELDRLEIPWHEVPALDRPLHPTRDMRAYRQLRSLFRREAFDLVHTHSSKPGFLGRLAARRAGISCIVHHVRGFAFHEFTPPHIRWFYKRLEKLASRYCDRILFVNHEERCMAESENLVRKKQAETIYNGADLQRLTPPTHAEKVALRRSIVEGLGHDEVAILFSGRLEPQKQPLILADIVHVLRSMQTRFPWRLLIAGNGPLESELKSRLESFGALGSVSFLGWQSNIQKIYGAADAILLPSLFEGLSRSLIEAHSMGVPCVVSNVKGNREVVTKETGFLCSPKDPADYAKHLATLIDNPFLRNQMGQAARRRAEEHFDTVTNNRRIVQVYEELLAEKGVRPRLADTAHSAPQRRAA